jgi:hypothetical protein
MKILLDHNLPRKLRSFLAGHDVRTARQMRWDQRVNGDLLQAAAGGGLEAFLTIDKNLPYQQNLATLPLPVVIFDSDSNALPAVTPFVPHVLRLLSAPLERVVYLVHSDGQVTQFRR